MAGEPWIAKEWLSQVVLAAAFNFGGWPAVAAVASGAIAAGLGLAAWFLAGRVETRLAIALLGVAFLLSAPHLLARPHALALPVMVAWTVVLLRAGEATEAPPWWALGLMVVWVNLHGSFVLGLALAVGLGADAVVSAPAEGRAAVARRWGAFTLFAGAAAVVTPYGLGIVAAAVDVLRLGAARGVIIEWQPADFASPGPVELVVLGLLGATLATRFVVRWPRALVLAGLIGLALSSIRNGDVLGFLGPLVIATPLAAHLDRAPRPGRARPGLVALAAIVVAAPGTVMALQRDDLAPAPSQRPVEAVIALEELGVERILNDYGFGGYLIHEGVPTFIDGRAELFGADAVVGHDAAVRADPPSALHSLLEGQGIEATVLQPGTPALAFLDADANWERVHADATAVVHLRVDRAG